jgi:hypothetical protein
MEPIPFEKETELAKRLLERVRNGGRDFMQMFTVMDYEGELSLVTMDEETAERRADAIVRIVHTFQAKQVVFLADTWYSTFPKDEYPSMAADDAITPPVMPADDPNHQEALVVSRFRPGSTEIATFPYEMVDGKVVWGEPLPGKFSSETFPRVREALAIVRLRKVGAV